MIKRNYGLGRLSGLWGAMLLLTAVGCGETAAPTAQLDLVVNGEAFAEAGLSSKDGWQITFDQVNVAVGEVKVSGSTAESADGEDALEVPWSLEKATQDKAAGFAAVGLQDGPVNLGGQTVPVGNYNQVQWQWGTPSMSSLTLKGMAVQGQNSVPFSLQFPGGFLVACGDYVGDERKGIVTADADGEVELTLHLDHLFGDGESPPNAEINTQAMGFDPFLKLAGSEGVMVTPETWEQWGTPTFRQTLKETLMSMPHVGEGHCEVTAQAP